MFSEHLRGHRPVVGHRAFIGAQIVGGVLAIAVIKALYPAITPEDAADIIVPHDERAGRAAARAAHDGTSPSADRPPPGPARPR